MSAVRVAHGPDYVDIIGEGGVTIRVGSDQLSSLLADLCITSRTVDGALLSRGETIARLQQWAEDMLTATPPKTGYLHLLDAIHYLAWPAETTREHEVLLAAQNIADTALGLGAFNKMIEAERAVWICKARTTSAAIAKALGA